MQCFTFRLKIFLTQIQGWQVAIVSLWLFYFIFLHWNSFLTPLHPDEGEYAYSAWLIKQGGTPYKDAFIQKPPLIIYTYFFGQLFDAEGVWSPRFLAFIFTLVSAVLLALIAKKEWGQRAGWLALWLYPLINLFPGFTPYTANTEKFLLLPLIGLLAIFVLTRSSHKNIFHFLAGALLSLSVFYKPIALPIGLFILGVWLLKIWRNLRKIRLIFQLVILQFFGFLLISGLILAPFLLTNSFLSFWNAVIVFNRYYALSDYFSPLNFLWFGIVLVRYWWILGLGLVVFWLLPANRKKFYASLFLVSIINIAACPFAHYYILIAPFLCLTVVCGFNAFLDAVFSVRCLAKNGAWLTFVLLAAVIFLLIWPFYGRFSLSSAELSSWLYGRDFLDSIKVANKIKEKSDTQDKIFVTCSEPQIYFYAKRQGVSRFIILFPLNIVSPFQKQYQEEVTKSLFEKKPSFIVRCNLDEHQGYWGEIPPKISHQLFTLLQENYRLIGGYQKQDGNNFWWEASEETSRDLIHKSNYLVYQLIRT